MRAFLAAMAETVSEMCLKPLYSDARGVAGRSTSETTLDVTS